MAVVETRNVVTGRELFEMLTGHPTEEKILITGSTLVKLIHEHHLEQDLFPIASEEEVVPDETHTEPGE
jgi:hypothetical protein